MKRVLVLMLLLVFVGGASGTDYYLATTGNNGNTGLSIAQAWLTPTYAVGNLPAGDTLWVVDGTYVSSTAIEVEAAQFGSASAWTRIKAHNGTPVWDGNGASVDGFRVGESSDTIYTPAYVELNGIHIKQFGISEIAIDNVCNVLVKNCIFANSSIALPTWRSLMNMDDGVCNVTIDNCSFIDSGNFGINAMGDRFGETTILRNITVSNCYFEDTTNHDAIQIADNATNINIIGNTFYDCAGFAGTYYHTLKDSGYRQNNITINDNICNKSSKYGMYVMGAIDSTLNNNTLINVNNDAFVVCSASDNITISNNSVSVADSLYDDANSNFRNGEYMFYDNTYSGLSVAEDYYARSGGKLIIKNDNHKPEYRINMRNLNTIGNVTVEYSDNTVFTHDYSTIGANYLVYAPKWYPSISNFTFYATAVSTEFTVDITTYNVTLVPTNSCLKDVTVNRESNSTFDITNITVNSSVSSNPTWINATMQNATNTYNISIDGVYTSQVVTDSTKVAQYQYSSSWSSHDFEFDWHSAAGFSGPPDPINLANTTGTTWVRHSWAAGSGNITDAYNISISSVWHNTTNAYHNNTGMAGGAWSNITVWAFNTTGGLSAGSISQDTKNSGGGGWSPLNTGTYYNTTNTIMITAKTDGTNLFSRTPTQSDCNATTSFSLKVII